MPIQITTDAVTAYHDSYLPLLLGKLTDRVDVLPLMALRSVRVKGRSNSRNALAPKIRTKISRGSVKTSGSIEHHPFTNVICDNYFERIEGFIKYVDRNRWILPP